MELIILPKGLNQLYLDIVKPSPISYTEFIQQIFPMHLCSNAKNQEQNRLFFFSPLIFILKWQTKEACIQHPKLDLNVYNEDLRFHPKRSIRNGLSFFQSNTNWTKCVKHLKPQLSRHRATENKRWFPRAGEVRPMLGSVTALDSRPQWVEGDPAGTRRTLWIQHIGLKI